MEDFVIWPITLLIFNQVKIDMADFSNKINIKNIEKQLLLHLTHKVRWRESIQFLLNQGVVKFIEMSHFDLLSKMGPFISRKVQWLSATYCEEN